MPNYKAPIEDMSFVLYELLDAQSHYRHLYSDDQINAELIDAILTEGAKFAENELSPLFRQGDEQGCRLESGSVKTPDGYKQAYEKFVENGWPALAGAEEYGGQGLPNSLGTVFSEMVGSANWSWAMYPGLSHGAMHTIESHGTEDQKRIYLPKLVSGQWSGTMCLTESQCGSDLGILRCKAQPNPDGSFKINGTKIFISAGEHDLTENIVHIVLARLPDAPEGTKGISLFIVPKYLPNAEGEVGERNAVNCSAIEHKMGIHGSATCVLNFDDATGFLVGPEHKGLNCMFTFMNVARIGTALQGVCTAEASFQGALAYARERTSMRALSGTKAPEKTADPIIVHPDVRRMLLTQKALAEGGRAFCYYLSMLSDIVSVSQNESDVKEAEDLMALLTPVAKAFLTELGIEAANLGVQVLGGHGYISEWGMEQLVRDARIATLYEGTTGIQALDLLGRKVLLTQGQLLRNFTKIIHKYCQSLTDDAAMAPYKRQLEQLNKQWGEGTQQIGMAAMKNREAVGAAAVDYLMFSGYVILAYFWARMIEVSQRQEGSKPLAFYQAKVHTGVFYFDRLLPRAQAHFQAMLSGEENLLAIEDQHFAFL